VPLLLLHGRHLADAWPPMDSTCGCRGARRLGRPQPSPFPIQPRQIASSHPWPLLG
jgi:hypothetical protein